VRVLADGKEQFLSNEHYPAQIARDLQGRLMMQDKRSDDLPPECNHLDMLVPPDCPAWGVFVIDPVAQTDTHWVQGERGFHGAVDFPLTPARLKEAAETTSSVSQVGPGFSDEDGKVTRRNLGERNIEGISSHGVRWTLRYDANENGKTVRRRRIHEVWTSTEMHLVVRVIDGDPNGEETIWGLEKISLSPSPALFQPPDGYELQHRQELDTWGAKDFDVLKTWSEE